ncbi:hypothetical protein ABWH96_03955 [Marivirga tractuosa]|uniref:HYC_CC_PP family protein n=1 Tax=Marivirga tractuosa TaxID=1006 RepID=UPI0035CECB35
MKKVISIFLLFIMLASSSGVTMATHLCGEHVAKMAITFGQTDLNCGMDQMEMDCTKENSHTGHQFQGKGCCENQYASMEFDEATTTKIVLKSIQLDFLVAFAYTYLGINPFAVDADTQYLNYSPPKLSQDIHVLYQSFLI